MVQNATCIQGCSDFIFCALLSFLLQPSHYCLHREFTVLSAAPFPFFALETFSVPAGLDPGGVLAEPMHPIFF